MSRTAVAAVLLLSCIACASAYTWDSCGTRYDRLKTTSLTFSAEKGVKAGHEATITTKGTTDLHVPLVTGAWQVRIYELGKAKSIDTAVGNLISALHFTDKLNTTFEMSVGFTLPEPQAQNNFTASLMATDQSKGMYCCLEVMYSYEN
eukprot:CAMPEP_0197439768 /NCGR_PEP_ID=MMETSP1175-20131217/6431_1 /TAXON_ID=1003142 /ORGANISM="Triceratium dubium, Strain CCMP147" /LENGTH=147 /DNA_ID=CAMNT_0042969743 /DNA_START=37 /DNA_END=480 /DNA_ORIENTATION=+